MGRFRTVQSMTPDERETRLPVWAQDIINTLRRRTRQAEEALAEYAASTDPENSPAVVDPYSDNPRGLSLTTINFRLGDEIVQVGVKGESLEISAVNGGLTIRPHVSNVISVKVESLFTHP